MDDSDLARLLDEHLGDHPTRVRECVVCAVILAHHASWRQHRDFLLGLPGEPEDVGRD